jgi:hypothetical protein
MQTQPIACIRCSNPGTLGVGQTHVCVECGSTWDGQPPLDAAALAQLQRLRIYRAAVRAGLYSDYRPRF